MTKEEASRARIAQKLVAKYQRVFTSMEGREVLSDMMKVNFVLSSTYREDDATGNLLREGQRNAVLRILTILKIDPGKLLDRINEQKEEESHVEV